MDQGRVVFEIDGPVARVTFDRPQARNAMTWSMYEQLAEACARIDADRSLRVAVLRGAGGRAFVAGTDIAQFLDFRSGEDGLRYEEQVGRYLDAVGRLRVPTLCVIEGWAIGGGLAIAASCDLRIATPGSRFGVPIARTLGNCLSAANLALLVSAFGVPRVKKMLLLAENLEADEALAAGFLAELVAPEALEPRIAEYCQRLAGHAPITMRVTRELLRRLLLAGAVEDRDLLAECYGSHDFRAGVQAFVDKRPAEWTGT
jgi:enoyl-CoA hydratase/carnithine racemase